MTSDVEVIPVYWCANHRLIGGAWCAMKDKAAGPCRMVRAELHVLDDDNV